jgi:hypothetical protein
VLPDPDAALVHCLGVDERKSRLLVVGVETFQPDEENTRGTRAADLLGDLELSDCDSRGALACPANRQGCARALIIVSLC